MARRSTLLTAFALAAFAAGADAQSATQAGAAAPSVPSGPEVGQTAPDFTAQWADGAAVAKAR
jgi:hypothetical protein